MAEEDLMTVREVARACNRTEETVRRWIWSGKLPARKIGNQLFVERAALAGVSGARPQPALREAGVEYKPAPYDRAAALENLRQAVEFGQELAAKYGPTDVSELLRQVREEEDE